MFRVATCSQTRIKEIKTSLRISTEAVGIAYEKTQREEVHSTLLPSDVLIETSYISVDDHFAALQIVKRSGVENFWRFGRIESSVPKL